jgi:hypothetical protein
MDWFAVFTSIHRCVRTHDYIYAAHLASFVNLLGSVKKEFVRRKNVVWRPTFPKKFCWIIRDG